MHRFFHLGPVSLFLLAVCALLAVSAAAAPAGAGQKTEPDSVCGSCHREIYERYRRTPMANASGVATDGVINADFLHAASGIRYEVSAQGGRVWLSFVREDASRALNGRRELRYFIGSGMRGRTFLFETDGYWFEAPINWYSKMGMWDMAPNHLSDRTMPLTMPVDSSCLRCHASEVAKAMPEARNRYAGEPFAAGGIRCEGCHGNGAAHVGSEGRVKMLEIDNLKPVLRDSVCLNCHLEGQVSAARKGKKIEEFVPGEDLFDYSVFFRLRTEKGSGGRATSQWEALLNSACKKNSGDRLTCTTCHDPHGSPPAEDRVAYYRERCLSCHGRGGFGASHHTENPDCTSCHMARSTSTDIAHEQVTDHFIRKRRPVNGGVKAANGGDLDVIGPVAATDRDLGMGYSEMAIRGDAAAGVKALELLRREEKEENGAKGDPELHARVGFLEQAGGDQSSAAREYGEAMSASPYNSVAEGNLGLIRAQQRDYASAIQLWKTVFADDPVQLTAGMNLAISQCKTGDRPGAIETLTRVLEFSPDDDRARSMMRGIEGGVLQCGKIGR